MQSVFGKGLKRDSKRGSLHGKDSTFQKGIEILGPSPDRSKSPNAQKDGSGLKKASKMQQTGVHKTSGGADRLGGLIGPDSLGPKQAGPLKCPRVLKVGDRGNRGLEKGFKVARLGPKGVTYCSEEKKRMEDGGSRPGAECSLEPLADPAWICARGPLLQEARPSPRGTSGFESCWEEGLGVVSSDCPLMGISYQDHGEEGFSAARSFALVEAVSRCPEEDDPEALQNHAKGSRFETVPSSVDYSSPTFSVFGRPLLSGGSSSLGDFHEYEALGEMEPLRVVSVDGREWGKGIADALMEGGQASVGLGSLRKEPSNVSPECMGYNTWEDSCLIKFSEFLGVTTAGFEEEILELLRKMEARQQGDKRKGYPTETRCERELRKLECTINYS